MNLLRHSFALLAISATLGTAAGGNADAPYVSEVWSPDNGNGTYTNPIINADYSDPDVVCVGDDFYLTASSFCNVPALPILHSRDLVNWEIINYVVKSTLLPEEYFNTPQHGGGVWAPSFRYHDGTYYIYWGDPDWGIFMVKTTDPRGEWDAPVLVKEGKGIIDTCPLWDEDGRAYLVNAYAKSRSGLNAVLTVTEMSPDGTRLIGEPVLVYDGLPDGNHTTEGPKFYKHDGMYYILAPAGGVATGWQIALRSKSPYGPYEVKTVMAQGNTDINAPHQGGMVTTPAGEDWFIHFQDKGVVGRVVHLNPVTWVDGWPVMGVDKDGDGCGDPVRTFRKPKVAGKTAIVNPVESDEFNSPVLGKQWQWYANYQLPFGFPTSDGYFRLYGYSVSENFVNMREVPNILTQKFPNEEFTATAKVRVSATIDGQESGLAVMGNDYCRLAVEKQGSEFVVKLIECKSANKGKPETELARTTVASTSVYGDGLRASYNVDLWLKVKVRPAKVTDKNGNEVNAEYCQFYYSTNGKKFNKIGEEFSAREGHWIGARFGFFSIQPHGTNRGWMDIDWIRVTKK